MACAAYRSLNLAGRAGAAWLVMWLGLCSATLSILTSPTTLYFSTYYASNIPFIVPAIAMLYSSSGYLDSDQVADYGTASSSNLQHSDAIRRTSQADYPHLLSHRHRLPSSKNYAQSHATPTPNPRPSGNMSGLAATIVYCGPALPSVNFNNSNENLNETVVKSDVLKSFQRNSRSSVFSVKLIVQYGLVRAKYNHQWLPPSPRRTQAILRSGGAGGLAESWNFGTYGWLPMTEKLPLSDSCRKFPP
ncbi:hypothetical protein B0H11DRAFT_1913082 [Mycena galericulata]|nr:hypothetical protein B0H11DRAFT_1913082 [Mycena galericulata]